MSNFVFVQSLWHASGGGFENDLRSQQRLLREPWQHCRRLIATIETDSLADTTEKDNMRALCARFEPNHFNWSRGK